MQQDEADGAEQRVERRAQRADERLHVVARYGGVFRVEEGRELFLVRLAERGEFRGGLLEGHAGPEARDGLRIARAPLDLRGGQPRDLEHARGEHLHLAEGIAEMRRENADDLPRHAVELDGFADEGVAPAEARLPQLMAEDAHIGAVGHVLRRGERAAAEQRNAEGGEKIGGDAEAVQLLGITVAGEGEVVERAVGDRREGLGAAAEFLVARPGDRGDVEIDLGIAGPDRDEGRRLGQADGPEHKPVEDGEERGVGADADGDGQDRDEGEPRRLEEGTVGEL